IDGVRINTPDFTFRADHITARQLVGVLDRLAGRALGTGGAAAPPQYGSAGPASIRTPSEQFASEIAGVGDSSPARTGFAPGGPESTQQMDLRGLINMMVQWLDQFLQTLGQLLGG